MQKSNRIESLAFVLMYFDREIFFLQSPAGGNFDHPTSKIHLQSLLIAMFIDVSNFLLPATLYVSLYLRIMAGAPTVHWKQAAWR